MYLYAFKKIQARHNSTKYTFKRLSGSLVHQFIILLIYHFTVSLFYYFCNITTLSMSTKNIIQNIKNGNKEAFKAFFDDYYPILCVFAEKYLKTPDKSKDAAQDAFVKFWNKRDEFDNINGVKSFLYVVTKNNCINILKKSNKNEDLDHIKELESESFLKENIINKETFAIVRNAVNTLPERQRKIVELSMQGFKNPEIAEELNITFNTVHTAKKNAYRKLREMLKDKYYLLLFIW